MALSLAQALKGGWAPGLAKPSLGKETQTSSPESTILGSATYQLCDFVHCFLYDPLWNKLFFIAVYILH